MKELFFFYPLAVALDWAVLLGSIALYVAVALYVGRVVSGLAGKAMSLAIILVPIVWIGAAYLSFWRLCSGQNELVYHQRETGVEGVLALGYAIDAMSEDIESSDGYLHYELKGGNGVHQVTYSAGRRNVTPIAQAASRRVFEVSEPRPRNPWLFLSQSTLQVRDTATAVVMAEGTDYLIGAGILDLLLRPLTGVHNRAQPIYWACGPGVEPGLWRGTVNRSGEYRQRDKRFVRTALIPARSRATLEAALPAPVLREVSPMSFADTLARLVDTVRNHPRYYDPVLEFRGSVPESFGSYARSQARNPPSWEGRATDADLSRATYWVTVHFSPKDGGREQAVLGIRVIQQRDAVVVKAVPLKNRDEVFGTETLELRRRWQGDLGTLVQVAVIPPLVPK